MKKKIPSLVGIQNRISQGLKVLQYYTTKNWVFKNEKFLHMKEKMTVGDRKKFYFSVEEVAYRLCFLSQRRQGRHSEISPWLDSVYNGGVHRKILRIDRYYTILLHIIFGHCR